MKRILIVNADDCNLTSGVTRSILECHDQGILSSTTFMINLPVEPKTVRELLRRPSLGVGIHMNVTLGSPVSLCREVRSLLDPDGHFKKKGQQLRELPDAEELFREYQSQVRRFVDLFGKKPTHIDTHHQMHDHPFFFKAVADVASKFHLPVRRSAAFSKSPIRLRTTDYFFGNLTPEGHWQKQALETVLFHLPPGVSEVMCHPGYIDKDLRSISSFTSGRETERRLFSHPAFLSLLRSHGITLAHFGLCYT